MFLFYSLSNYYHLLIVEELDLNNEGKEEEDEETDDMESVV